VEAHSSRARHPRFGGAGVHITVVALDSEDLFVSLLFVYIIYLYTSDYFWK